VGHRERPQLAITLKLRPYIQTPGVGAGSRPPSAANDVLAEPTDAGFAATIFGRLTP
jgi:hypothetical protein